MEYVSSLIMILLRPLSVLLICYFHYAQASDNPYLLLTKIGSGFQLRIEQYEELTFRLKDEEYFVSGIIEDFTDSSFYVYETEIPLREIAEIDIRNKNHSIWSFRSSPGKLVTAGIMLMTMDLLNQREKISKKISIISGSLILAGVIMKIAERKYFAPGKRNKLHIINL